MLALADIFLAVSAVTAVVLAVAALIGRRLAQSRVKEAETRLEASRSNEEDLQAQVIRLSNFNSDLAGRLRHDLVGPLSNIDGFAALLENGDLTPKQRTFVKHIRGGAAALLQRIDALTANRPTQRAAHGD